MRSRRRRLPVSKFSVDDLVLNRLAIHAPLDIPTLNGHSILSSEGVPLPQDIPTTDLILWIKDSNQNIFSSAINLSSYDIGSSSQQSVEASFTLNHLSRLKFTLPLNISRQKPSEYSEFCSNSQDLLPQEWRTYPIFDSPFDENSESSIFLSVERAHQLIDSESRLPVLDMSKLNEKNSQHFPFFRHCNLNASVSSGVDCNSLEVGNISASKLQKIPKTTHGILIMCLYLNLLPPEQFNFDQSFLYECWINPVLAELKFPSKGCCAVVNTLQAQYTKTIKDIAFISSPDPSIEDLKKKFSEIHESTKGESRVLFHYNGHGAPEVTKNGELWVLGSNKTHFYPIHIKEILSYLGGSIILILDCNASGRLVKYWESLDDFQAYLHNIFIAACSSDETLPTSTLFPGDILTAALTTPLRIALEFYIHQTLKRRFFYNVTSITIQNIPGSLQDPSTPLGELNLILCLILHIIAWCTFSFELYQLVLRQDSATCQIFLNFILADRILREFGKHPCSIPALPKGTHSHRMWDMWDATLDRVISQLPKIMHPDSSIHSDNGYQPVGFLESQLKSFRVWMGGLQDDSFPERLPVLLYALKHKVTRLEALVLLAHYLNIGGRKAALHVISCGFSDPLAREIENPDVILLLIAIWTLIIRHTASQTTDILRQYKFIEKLMPLLHANFSDDIVIKHSDSRFSTGKCTNPRAKDAAENRGNLKSRNNCVLAHSEPINNESVSENDKQEEKIIMYTLSTMTFERSQSMIYFIFVFLMSENKETDLIQCWSGGLLQHAFYHVSNSTDIELRLWSLLAMIKLVTVFQRAKTFVREVISTRHLPFNSLLNDPSPLIRSCAVMLFSTFSEIRVDFLTEEEQIGWMHFERSHFILLRSLATEPSSLVRNELAYYAAHILQFYSPLFPKCITKSWILSHKINAWALHETPLQVFSTLTIDRPTTNPIFQEISPFDISYPYLEKDDPIINEEWNMSALSAFVLETITALINDAATLLVGLRVVCDGIFIDPILDQLESRIPLSTSYYKWAMMQTMSYLTATDRVCLEDLSEQDRTRGSRNAELMLQLLVDLKCQTEGLEDDHISLEGSLGAKSLTWSCDTACSVSDSNGLSVWKQSIGKFSQKSSNDLLEPISLPSCSRFVWFPNTVPKGSITTAAFRFLEPEVILVENGHRFHIIKYGSIFYADGSTSLEVLHSFDHERQSHVRQIEVVNDLSENYGLMALEDSGKVVLYGAIEMNDYRQCHVVSRFMALSWVGSSHPFPLSLPNIHMSYQPSTGHAIFCGDGGHNIMYPENSDAFLSIISLITEQLVQSITLPSVGDVVSLSVHPSQPSVCVGCADGVVSYLDDRDRRSSLSAVAMLHVNQKFPSSFSNSCNYSSTNDLLSRVGFVEGEPIVWAATRKRVVLFDLRHFRKPIEIISFEEYGNSNSFSGGNSILSEINLKSVGIGFYNHLLWTACSDNTLAVYRFLSGGLEFIEKTPLEISDNLSWIVPHPLRSLICCGSECVALW